MIGEWRAGQASRNTRLNAMASRSAHHNGVTEAWEQNGGIGEQMC
jgi:hypothetical protein